MNKPLLSLLKELKQGQRFDNKSFEEAGCLIYDLDELVIKEGVLNEVFVNWLNEWIEEMEFNVVCWSNCCLL